MGQTLHNLVALGLDAITLETDASWGKYTANSYLLEFIID